MANELYQTLDITPDATPEEIKRAYFRLVRKHSPEKDPETFKTIRSAYETLSDPKSREDYNSFQMHGEEIQELLAEAEGLIQEERWEEAIRPLKKVLVLAPGVDAARNYLGLCYLYGEDWDNAIKVYRALTKRRHDVPLYWMNYGCVFTEQASAEEDEQRQNDLRRQARELFLKANELEPFNSESYLAISRTYKDEGKFLDALSWAERALGADGKVDIQDFDALFEICMIHLRSGQHENIERTANRIIGLLPEGDEDARKYAAYQFAKFGLALGKLHLFSLEKIFHKAALQFDPTDDDVRVLYESSQVMEESMEAYDTFINDSNILNFFHRIITFFMAEASGEELDDRDGLLEDILEELNYCAPRDVHLSLNRIKAQYPSMYRLNPTFFDDLAEEMQQLILANNTSTYTPPSGGTSSGGTASGGGPCFVATATFGSPWAEEVTRFRRYRDQVLAKSVWGRGFIRCYYKVGPHLGRVVERRPSLKAVSARFLGWLVRRLPL